jgi:phosphatidylinositol alpha-1,6-mannosyltransferase
MNESRIVSRVLLSAQSLISGNGGISAVARMTASALSHRCRVEALACQDLADHRIETVPVRAFANRRFAFSLANFAASQRATHVIYDFAGTARAHVDLPFRRRRYAVWVHGLEVWHAAPPKYLHAVSKADLILANSAYTVTRANGVLPDGIEVVTCPLGTPQDSPPAKVGPSDGPPTVMLLGRADELFAKGHDLLIEVWPEVVSAVPDAKLLLVGGGRAVDKVRGLAAASPARNSIEITGFVPDDALDASWRRATVFAMLGFTEGFGLVYIEAMRHGLPVIASTEDAGQEINVDGKTGFNVPCRDRRRLTEVLVTLLRDGDLARSLGAAGHLRWKEQYTFSAFERRLAAATNRFLTS